MKLVSNPWFAAVLFDFVRRFLLSSSVVWLATLPRLQAKTTRTNLKKYQQLIFESYLQKR